MKGKAQGDNPMCTCMVNNMRMFIAHFSWSGNEESEEMIYLSRKTK